MSTTSRKHVCRVFVALISGPKTVDELSVHAEIGIDAARHWVRAMHEAALVRPTGVLMSKRRGTKSIRWEWVS